jgi:hypothetical protein
MFTGLDWASERSCASSPRLSSTVKQKRKSWCAELAGTQYAAFL